MGSSARAVFAFNSLHIALPAHSGSEDWKLSPWHWNMAFQTGTLHRSHWFFFHFRKLSEKNKFEQNPLVGAVKSPPSLAEHSSLPIRNVMCLHVVPGWAHVAQQPREPVRNPSGCAGQWHLRQTGSGGCSPPVHRWFWVHHSKLFIPLFHSAPVGQLGLRPFCFLNILKSYFPDEPIFYVQTVGLEGLTVKQFIFFRTNLETV